MKCAWHTCEKPIVAKKSNSKFCSKQCKNKYHVDKRRRGLKQKAIIYKGGKCEICGYKTSFWSLSFHHKDKLSKNFGISTAGHTKAWSTLKKELDLCMLVCANCHGEIHEALHNA